MYPAAKPDCSAPQREEKVIAAQFGNPLDRIKEVLKTMFASVRVYEGVDPSGGDEIARKAREGLIPLLRKAPGFVDYLLVEAGGGTWATVSLFEDRTGAEQSAQTATGWVRENLAELVKTTPRIVTGEVVARSAS